jgi:hypothetical protein
MARLLSENALLQALDLSSSGIGSHLTSISAAISRGRMQLTSLHLAENAISVDLGVELVRAGHFVTQWLGRQPSFGEADL